MGEYRKVRFTELRTLRPQKVDEKVVVEKDGEGTNGLYAYNAAFRSWGRIAVKDAEGQWQAPNVVKKKVKKQIDDTAVSSGSAVEPTNGGGVQEPNTDGVGADAVVEEPSGDLVAEQLPDENAEPNVPNDTVTESDSRTVSNIVDGDEVSVVEGSDITPFEPNEPEVKEGAPVEPEQTLVQPPAQPKQPQPQTTVQQKIAAAKLKLSQSAFSNR